MRARRHWLTCRLKLPGFVFMLSWLQPCHPGNVERVWIWESFEAHPIAWDHLSSDLVRVRSGEHCGATTLVGGVQDSGKDLDNTPANRVS
jgi:hypothetical protein